MKAEEHQGDIETHCAKPEEYRRERLQLTGVECSSVLRPAQKNHGRILVEHVDIDDGNENQSKECREQGNAAADRLQKLVKDQRHADVACAYRLLGDAP